MSVTIGERYFHAIETEELERRWKVTREEMSKQQIDCIVLYNVDRRLGGAMKYYTDLPIGSYPASALFPIEGGMTYIGHGPAGAKAVFPYAARGVEYNIAVPMMPVMGYTDNDIGVEEVRIIKEKGYKKIGWYRLNTIPAALYNYLTENLPECEFVACSQMIDDIKAIKSEKELEILKTVVDTHDFLLAAVPSMLRPGRTEREITDEIQYLAMKMGASNLNVLVGSDTYKPVLTQYFFQNRTLQKGDLFQCLIEVDGPSGYWGEIGRVFALGEPPAVSKKAFYDAAELQLHIGSLCKPGVKAVDMLVELNRCLEERGYFKENRLYAHGQGYDMVERPSFVEREDMEFKENMFVAIHPTCANEKTSAYCCDNYVITKDGGLRLNRSNQELIVL